MTEVLNPAQNSVEIARDGAITTIRMHTEGATQPPHALSKHIWEGLDSAFNELAKDSKTRVIILRGSRKLFSSGANFDELLKVLEEDEKNGNNKAAKDYWRLVNYTQTAIEKCPQPVIAVLERFALGAAFALAMSCDFRVTDAKAQLGVPAPQRGLTLGLIDTRRIVGKVGGATATELLMLGKIFTADEAYQRKLVDFVAETGKIDEEVGKLAQLLAGNAPLAMKEAKANI